MSTVKVSVTIDEQIVAEIKSSVGARGLSRFINETLAQRLQQQRLLALRAELDAEHGAIPDEMQEAARTELARLLRDDGR